MQLLREFFSGSFIKDVKIIKMEAGRIGGLLEVYVGFKKSLSNKI